jgi:DNA-directed RNA polymerase specialized sigma24 family protein
MAAPPSLLQRVRQGDPAAWSRLVDLCSPHLFLWACRAGLHGAEAGQFLRKVFTELAGKTAAFQPGQSGGFRGWLRSLAHAQRREMLLARQLAGGGPAQPATDPDVVPPDAESLWQEEYLPVLLRSAIDQLRGDFAPALWHAFEVLSIEGLPSDQAARTLGVGEAALQAGNARVLFRLRQEFDGLLD